MTTGADEQTDAGRRQLLGQLAGPVRRFVTTESGSASLLLAATLIALAWANSPWSESYADFWGTELSVRLGDSVLELDLKHWVNDGLMVFFFLIVGLEVRRELAIGELDDPRKAAVPVAGAVAGLAIPALIYLAFNPSGEAARAWGVVISTDTAFLLGVLALVGPGCSTQLRIFLLTLAVADDIGALAIIALVYTDDLQLFPLALAAAGIALMLVMRSRIWRGPPYFVIAVGIWIATYESGVHPTIAGVAIALLTPVFPPRREHVEEAGRLARAFQQSPGPQLGRAARLSVDRAVSPNERLQELFLPWSSYVIVPVFALANAGVSLSGDTLSEAVRSPLTLGIVAGLVGGKCLGITAGALAAARFGPGELGRGITRLQLMGGAALTGIGFTISLFIVDLALEDQALQDQARVGVLAASLIAASLGWALFRVAERFRDHDAAAALGTLARPVEPERDHIHGPHDAPLTLVEYADFECPFCGRATGMIDDVREHFGDRLRYVFRHLPLIDVHAHAEQAAHAAEAAGAQGRFWEMHDLLFERQDALSGDDLVDYAEQLGLDVDRFVTDLREGTHDERVREDVAAAEASGVRGTPTFFVGERRHRGRHDAETLIRALEES